MKKTFTISDISKQIIEGPVVSVKILAEGSDKVTLLDMTVDEAAPLLAAGREVGKRGRKPQESALTGF